MMQEMTLLVRAVELLRSGEGREPVTESADGGLQ